MTMILSKIKNHPQVKTIRGMEPPKIEMPIDKDILTKYKFGNLNDNDTTKDKETAEASQAYGTP